MCYSLAREPFSTFTRNPLARKPDYCAAGNEGTNQGRLDLSPAMTDASSELLILDTCGLVNVVSRQERNEISYIGSQDPHLRDGRLGPGKINEALKMI